MDNLTNKTIIITGGLGLLGYHFSKACLLHGATVVISDIDEKKAPSIITKLKQETKRDAVSFQVCDITKKEQIKKVIENTVRSFGKIDALVNNAYPRNKNYGRKFEEVTYEDFCENVNMHLGGYFLMSQEVSKQMVKQKHGIIINMGSIYGVVAPSFKIYEGTTMTMPVEYAAIKAAIIHLTKYMAAYFGKYNIRVNAISPGGVFDDQSERFVKKYTEKVLVGERMAKQDDITGALIFLLSDNARYITGQNIVVDGGWSL